MRVSTIYIIIIGLVCYFVYYNASQTSVLYIKSKYDERSYLVRNESDGVDAANMLAKIREKLYSLREILYVKKQQYPKYTKYIEFMYPKMEHMIISENTSETDKTSYTVNKGEEMFFCIRSKKTNTIHDLNLLMFVAIHEMAHVMCPEDGHTPLFENIFMFILGVAITKKIYYNENFSLHPKEYCGMDINVSPNPIFINENDNSANAKNTTS